MKRSVLSILYLLTVTSIVNSQDPPRRDTAWGSWPHQEYYNSILQAPVVTGETTAQTITPNGQKLCFDKMIKIKSLTRSGPVEQCMYLNTKEGYSGLLPPVRGGGELCDIKPDDKKFVLWVFGLKGNAYTFKNSLKNRTIEHWVSTGNTQTHQISMTTGMAVLHKKTERRGYNGDMIKTWAYKHDNPSSPVYFLFGKTFPEEILVNSAKFIGNFGVGYQLTDKGLFIVMEMESGSFGCKIEEIKEVNVCFDPSAFKIGEDEFFTQMQTSLQREREKIAADEAKAAGDDCASEQMAVINFRKEQVRVQEARMFTAQQGNTYQSLPTQQAMAQMMDHVAITKQYILENRVKICQAQKRMERSRSQTSRDRYQQKISCLNNQIGELQSLQGQLETIDGQYPDEPGRAFAEKAKKFMQGLPGGCQ